jgi:hypothetical protein
LIIRVRRDDLYSPSQSPSSSPDPALGQAFLKSLRKRFAETVTSISVPSHVIDDEILSEEVEFRLFATTSSKDEKTITKIRVQSPSLDDGPAGLVNPERPREYYFRDSLSPEAEGRLKLVAVSGEDVLARSHTKWPGCSLPWRVTTILATGKQIPNISLQTDVARKKTRKGKKTRIAIRKKAVEERERKENEQKNTMTKELEERVKRAKRNREKKLKKKERDKAKKAAARAAGEEVAEGSDDASE